METSPTTAQLITRAEKAEQDLEKALEQLEVLRHAVTDGVYMIRYMKKSANDSQLGVLDLLEKWLTDDSAAVINYNELPF